jgi:glycosyltransferase involved in cell wall biosynthesis
MLSAESANPHCTSHQPRRGGSGAPAKTVRTSIGSARDTSESHENTASSRCGETRSSGPAGMPEMASLQPKLTVVIPARDAAGQIERQLDALAEQAWHEPWEVVVVDNGSRDRTRAVAERYADRLTLRIVDASTRPGQAFALNRGVEAARSEAVAFCDADDEVAPGWVAAMGDALSRSDLVACVSDVSKLNEAWVTGTREPQPPGGLSRAPFPPYAPYTGSGGLGVRRRTHDALGGFDESMPVLFDLDYCLKAHAAGIELRRVPGALMHYRYRSDLRGIFRQARLYAEQMVLVQRRHEDRAARRPTRKPWLLRGWMPVLRTLPLVHRRAGRAKLAWSLGWQLGRYVGSARYRYPAL